MTRTPPSRWSLAGGPLIRRGQGQRLARKELAEMSFWQRILHWFSRLLAGAGNAVPGGWFGLIVLAVLLAVAIVVVLWRVRPARAGRAAARAVLSGQPKTAMDYRQAAERLAAAGQYGPAIVAGARAIAAELDQRAILPPRPGRTADELAVEAGRELPGVAADLRAAMRLFDDVLYGDRDGSAAGYQMVVRVDADVRSARQAPAAAPATMAASGAPR